MITATKPTTHKAIKRHVCNTVCGTWIEPGQMYDRQRAFDCGDAWVAKTHIGCSTLLREIAKHHPDVRVWDLELVSDLLPDLYWDGQIDKEFLLALPDVGELWYRWVQQAVTRYVVRMFPEASTPEVWAVKVRATRPDAILILPDRFVTAAEPIDMSVDWDAIEAAAYFAT